MTIAAADEAPLRTACKAADLDSSNLFVLHHHATGVYLLPAINVIARLHRGAEQQGGRTAVVTARWAADHGVPVTEPVCDPVAADDVTVTFWRYYPQPDGQPAPDASALGTILRQLHQLHGAPTELSRYRPLIRLGEVLGGGTWLPTADHMWLSEQRAELLDQYAQIRSELGEGLIHGDAYPGNTLWDGERAILGDWDEVAHGPRELDLINTHQGARFGRSIEERNAFNSGYGWDVTTWPGFPTLRAMRDLHTLAAYIERSNAGDQAAMTEVRHRIQTLRDGDATARWHTA
jgi:phosphotransferase family enzyme